MTDLISKPSAITDPATHAFLRAPDARPTDREVEADIARRRWPIWKSVLFLGLSAAVLWGGVWMLVAQLLRLLK